MSTTPTTPFAIDELCVATPCRASWEAMAGDDRVRFCGACRKNVYQVAGLTRAEVAAILERTEGHACMRLHRRADGTVITADCPQGSRTPRASRRDRAARVAALALAVISALGVSGCGRSGNGFLRHSRARQWPVVGALLEWMDPTPAPMLMGEIYVPPSPSPSPTPTTAAPPPMLGALAPATPPAPSTPPGAPGVATPGDGGACDPDVEMGDVKQTPR